MTQAEALSEWNADTNSGSVETARDRIQRQIAWLERIAEHEYTSRERARLLAAYRDFYMVVRPIVMRVIDDA